MGLAENLKNAKKVYNSLKTERIYTVYDTNLYKSSKKYTNLYNLDMERTFQNNKIAELRKMQGISQRQLAEGVGTSQANVSRWEKGLNEPSVLECWKMADFFDVSIDILCGRKEY